VTEWSRPPASPRLVPGTAHVWRASLRLPVETVRRLGSLLSDDESARAGRLRSAELKADFQASRGIQRDILSRYTGIPAASLSFSYSAHGKPALERTGAVPDLCFNISNAGGMALFALTTHRRIGVDLEPIKPVRHALAIAERFFSSEEVQHFRMLPPEQVDRSFLTVWTRKEAFIKALGEGLSFPLADFDVSFAAGEPARLLRTRPLDTAAQWSMIELQPAQGFVGCLVAEGTLESVTFYDWDAAAGR
jgi:4'-phosphopantetheinyl transferase